jgi:hypothetical protein
VQSDGPKKTGKPNPLRILRGDAEPLPQVLETGWVGTDLAKFAQDVIALNRQAGSSPQPTKSDERKCRVASLESLQRGLKIRRGPEVDATSEQVTILRPHRKE